MMKIRIQHHKELWCPNPEWVETEVAVRGIDLQRDIVTDNPWGNNPYGTNPAYFDWATGKHHTWGQGNDHLDTFAVVHPQDLLFLKGQPT
jgi:hypothetical protein